MIQAANAIQYIENGLRQLIASGKVTGKIHRSTTSLSVYLNTNDTNLYIQKAIRSSNHRLNMQNMLNGRRRPWDTGNISIEFYEPQYNRSGKIMPNILLTKVRQRPNYPTIQPFSITVYEYQAAELDVEDIPTIFQEIVKYIFGGRYHDPFIDTEKMAQVMTRNAEIPGAVAPSKNDVKMNISNGEYGADDVVDENVKTKTITESTLRRIIRESLIEYLYN